MSGSDTMGCSYHMRFSAHTMSEYPNINYEVIVVDSGDDESKLIETSKTTVLLYYFSAES
jgi:hypothetical protein